MHMHHDHSAGGAALVEEDKATCPVMHIPVSKAETVENGLIRSFSSKIYYFCCKTCTDLWDKNPEQYVKANNDGVN